MDIFDVCRVCTMEKCEVMNKKEEEMTKSCRAAAAEEKRGDDIAQNAMFGTYFLKE